MIMPVLLVQMRKRAPSTYAGNQTGTVEAGNKAPSNDPNASALNAGSTGAVGCATQSGSIGDAGNPAGSTYAGKNNNNKGSTADGILCLFKLSWE